MSLARARLQRGRKDTRGRWSQPPTGLGTERFYYLSRLMPRTQSQLFHLSANLSTFSTAPPFTILHIIPLNVLHIRHLSCSFASGSTICQCFLLLDISAVSLPSSIYLSLFFPQPPIHQISMVQLTPHLPTSSSTQLSTRPPSTHPPLQFFHLLPVS